MMDRCFRESGGMVFEWEGLIANEDDITIPDEVSKHIKNVNKVTNDVKNHVKSNIPK